jgi:hypothetical protein
MRKGVIHQELIDVDLTRRVLGKHLQKAPIVLVVWATEDDVFTEEPVVERDLSGHHCAEVPGCGTGIEDVFFEAISQFDRVASIALRDGVRRRHPTRLEDHGTDLEPIEDNEILETTDCLRHTLALCRKGRRTSISSEEPSKSTSMAGTPVVLRRRRQASRASRALKPS